MDKGEFLGNADAELNLDGKGFRPDGKTAATLIPSAFGLVGVNNHTWTGSWRNVTYGNAYVSNLKMHGEGTFFDPRLDDPEKYPVAARTKQGHMRAKGKEGRITAKLPALHFNQLSLPTPEPPEGSYKAEAAEDGRALFNGKAKCATCQSRPFSLSPAGTCTRPRRSALTIFKPSGRPTAVIAPNPCGRFGIQRSSTRAAFFFYHDGRFATLADVVKHYVDHLDLELTKQEQRDLIEYLKSL